MRVEVSQTQSSPLKRKKTMPRISSGPPLPKGGPGSSFANTALNTKRSRRRRKKNAEEALPSQGSNDLDWKETSVPNIKSIVMGDAPRNTPATDENNGTIENRNNDEPPLIPLIRHALAVDTRFLETECGEKTTEDYLKDIHAFFGTLVNRGTVPCIIASTAVQENSARAKNPRVGVRSFRLEEGSSLEEILGGSRTSPGLFPMVPVRAPVNAANVKNRKAVHVPKALLAHDSWKLFSDLVASIVAEDSKSVNAGRSRVPLDVTILTNDVAFLCDTNQLSHKRALTRFWDAVTPHFHNSAIRSVQIVSATTGTVALATASTDLPGATEAAVPPSAELSEDSSSSDSEPKTKTAEEYMSQEHKINVATCIRAVQKHIGVRAEADFKAYNSTKDPVPPVSIDLCTVESNRLGYLSLLRKWLRQGTVGQRSRLSFDMPETEEGTQCAASLDVSYKTLPFKATSSYVKSLLEDLRLLSTSHIEVLQTVPMDLVDASLLYGVPMSIEAALEDDIEQYKEMKLLVNSLLKNLSQKNLALLLRCSSVMDSEQKGLFHANGQTFLLMAEELPKGVQANQVPSTGILYRYASAEQFLREAPSVGAVQDTDNGMAVQYDDYVERSLDCLECDAVNPLFVDATRPLRPSRVLKQANDNYRENNDGDSKWTDEAGVGSRPPGDCQDDSEEISDMDDDVGVFEYA